MANYLAMTITTIIGVGVTIPIVQSVITDSNVTGITATILNFVPVMVGVGILVGFAQFS